MKFNFTERFQCCLGSDQSDTEMKIILDAENELISVTRGMSSGGTVFVPPECLGLYSAQIRLGRGVSEAMLS